MFYKRMTSKGAADEAVSGRSDVPGFKQHRRVRNWTKGVDLFDKDFVFVPVNVRAHWFLVVICYARHFVQSQLGKVSGGLCYGVRLLRWLA